MESPNRGHRPWVAEPLFAERRWCAPESAVCSIQGFAIQPLGVGARRRSPLTEDAKMAEITPEMPERLLTHLRAGAPALLLTAGADGYPSSAYTWAVALDAKRVRFAVDAGGTALVNLKHSGLAGLHIIGPNDLAYLVKGKATKIKERIKAVAPSEMLLYELQLIGARDQSFPGVTAKPFTYEWPADQRAAMRAMEQAVFAEMRS